MSKRTSYDAAEHARELTADELDQAAGGTPNVTVNGGPLAFAAPLPPPCDCGLGHEHLHGRA